MKFFYVYILQSEVAPERFYIGLTDNLRERLQKHNSGDVRYTNRLRPWRVKTALAFTDRIKAAAFEKYLKTSSGRAFAKKHL